MTDPIAQILHNCPTQIVREVTVHADADTVTVSYVYDRASYERAVAEAEDRKRAHRRDLDDFLKETRP